ncbi:MAG: iron-containing alcohol dehydrogenase [Armatimonadetes bacterium]|nr:iron-containing alcohol dehydrogenase [Armatimonadota bacterium]
MSMSISKFVAPEIIFGLGALSQVGESALRLGATRLFVISDPGVVANQWVEKAIARLKEAGLSFEVWFEVTSNPKDYEVVEGVKQYLAAGCDAILAVGGGSPIDVAKAVAILATNKGVIQDYEGVNKITRPLPPLLVVPTTAGSGSEVSQFAIIVDTRRKIKMTIISKSLVPDIAIIDPVVLQTKDARLTAATGLDALSHAIESFVSLAATPLTNVHALNAIRLIARYLRPSVACRTNLEAKAAMAMAALQAGLAFSNAILGATHAMAHQLDAQLDLHHGETNAILLPYVMEFNQLACVEKFAQIAEAMGEDPAGLSIWEAAEKAIRAVRKLAGDLDIPEKISVESLSEEYITRLTQNALKDACIITNPRDVTERDIHHLFTLVLKRGRAGD